jgi:hypothetical protein
MIGHSADRKLGGSDDADAGFPTAQKTSAFEVNHPFIAFF